MGLFILLLIGAAVLYFLPIIISGTRNAAHHSAISALTLFLGWTVLGWIAALVWACTDDRGEDPSRRHCPFCDEMISPKASICPHCRKDVPLAEIASKSQSASSLGAMIAEMADIPKPR